MTHRTAAQPSLLTTLRHRREAAAERRQLAHDLAAYRSPAETSELLAILGRHTSEDTAQVRQLLIRAHAA